MSLDPTSVAKDFATSYYEQLLSANWRQLAEWYSAEAVYSRTDEETGVALPVRTVNVCLPLPSFLFTKYNFMANFPVFALLEFLSGLV